MHGFSPGEVSMERTHCGLYQAAATDDSEAHPYVSCGYQSPLEDRTGYLPRNTTSLEVTGQNPGHESFGPFARHWQPSAGCLRSSQSRIRKTDRKGAPDGRREAFLLLHSIRADGQTPWEPRPVSFLSSMAFDVARLIVRFVRSGNLLEPYRGKVADAILQNDSKCHSQ